MELDVRWHCVIVLIIFGGVLVRNDLGVPCDLLSDASICLCRFCRISVEISKDLKTRNSD